jgi:site-specific DNA-methyltransferase (adenine-specific)
MSAAQSIVFNEDCITGMKRYPDNYFDLAVVDPPYGIGFDGEVNTMVTNNASGKWTNAKGKGYKRKDWDSEKPNDTYFIELFRVSKNQIVWGGNYFNLPASGGWIVWDKIRPETFSLSQAELAWVRNSGRVSIFKYLWNGFQKQIPEDRFHPTQKPVKLYDWILKNYAKEGSKILDTHLGSGSSRIAAHKNGFDFTGFEIDKDYFEAQEKRFKEFTSQLTIF